jgi:hypothetical protein
MPLLVRSEFRGTRFLTSTFAMTTTTGTPLGY